jgi:DNA topoisomerase-1
MNTLIIVESPTKARKIQKYFNDGTIVKSSFGHIFDLPKNNISIDVNNNFKPNYQPIPGKEKIIKELYNLRKNHILLAADDDREGDAIAWHCGNLLKVNYNENNRIIFHEISKKSINEAILNPVQINMNSVNSQQARRIIDRLVGFNLSPLLWKHIDSDQKGLSAGRVQSTLLKILKDKMNEITNFQSQLKDDFQSEFRYNENHSINCEFISNEKVDPLKFLNLLKEN